MTKKEYAKITVEAETYITRLMERAEEHEYKDIHQHWAYGAFLLWNNLTCGWQKEGDCERLEALTK